MTMTDADLGLVDRRPSLPCAAAASCTPAPPPTPRRSRAARITGCDGRWITPGLIDCHTHLVFGGNRAAEFEARLAGASYAELAAIGGIRATVAATRAATTPRCCQAPCPAGPP